MKKTHVERSFLNLVVFGAVWATIPGCTIHDPTEPGLLVPATVDDDPSLPHVELEHTSLHVRTYGEPHRPKIFVLEGGPGADFRYMLPLALPVGDRRLADDYFVIFHDYRGSGLSRRHPVEELSLDVLREDLEELVDHFAQPDEPVILIGHSHGGLLAAQYIQANLDRVRGAVLLEPGEFSGEILKRQPALVEIDYLGRGVHDVTWVRQVVGAHSHATADYWMAISRESLDQDQRGDEEAERGKSWRRGAAALLAIPLGEMVEYQYDYTRGLKDFDATVLFISSSESQDLGYAFQEREQTHFFSSVEHVRIDGTGHSGLIESRHEDTLRHIFDYIDSLSPKE